MHDCRVLLPLRGVSESGSGPPELQAAKATSHHYGIITVTRKKRLAELVGAHLSSVRLWCGQLSRSGVRCEPLPCYLKTSGYLRPALQAELVAFGDFYAALAALHNCLPPKYQKQWHNRHSATITSETQWCCFMKVPRSAPTAAFLQSKRTPLFFREKICRLFGVFSGKCRLNPRSNGASGGVSGDQIEGLSVGCVADLI